MTIKWKDFVIDGVSNKRPYVNLPPVPVSHWSLSLPGVVSHKVLTWHDIKKKIVYNCTDVLSERR